METSSNEKLDLTPEFVLQLTEAQPRLFGFLLKRLVVREQVLEVLQDVNLTLCSKSDDFSPGSDFMAWAFSVARYQLLSYRQREARGRVVFSSELADAIDVLDERANLDGGFTDREDALENCLAMLQGQDRDLIVQRYGESMSVKAIAVGLGKSANAVSIALHRLREQLSQCVEQRLQEGV